MYPQRRHHKAMNLVAHIMHIMDKHLPKDANFRAINNELTDLFYATGAEVITEADRIQAGCMPRDHNGLTLEEIRLIDMKLTKATLEPIKDILKNE